MKKMLYFFKRLLPLIALLLSLAPVKYLMATPAVQDSIIGLYTAYYNRAPDQGGFNFWNQRAASTGNSAALLAISEGFSQHPQFLLDYPSSDSNTEFVTKIYHNILNRAPDAGGLAFWVKALDEGMPKSKFIVTYVNDVLAYSGTHPDGIKSKQMFNNKVTVGQCFIDALGAESNGEPNSLAYNRSIEVLSGVTEDNTSIGLAVNKIKSYLPANTTLPNSCPNDNSDGQANTSFTKLDANGVALANQSADYATTPWQCVKDNVTGLTWEVKTNDGSLHDKNDRYNWYNTDTTSNGGFEGYANDDGDICFGYNNADSSSYCNTQAYVARVNAATWCGANDWRMPTIEELRSIVSDDRVNPAIDTASFPNTVSWSFWSSSTNSSNSNSAWVLNFGYGRDDDYGKNFKRRVRLVRSGQNSDGQTNTSFTKLDANGVTLANQNADYATTPWQCVKDNVTGLTWEVKTNDGGLHDKNDRYNWYNTDTTSNGGFEGYANDDGDICFGYNNADSSSYCNTQAYVARVNAATWCGANDWRMPTIEELRSIVSDDRVNPAIDTASFPNTVSWSFWSSSPKASNSNSAWVLNFGYGRDDDYSKNFKRRVRLVRSGR